MVPRARCDRARMRRRSSRGRCLGRMADLRRAGRAGVHAGPLRQLRRAACRRSAWATTSRAWASTRRARGSRELGPSGPRRRARPPLHDADGPARGRDREAHGRGSLEGALEAEVLEEGEGVRFVHEDARGIVLPTKTVRAVPGTFDLDVELAVSSAGARSPRRVKFSLVAAVGMQAAAADAAYSRSPRRWRPTSTASAEDLRARPRRREPARRTEAAGSMAKPIGYFGSNKYFVVMRPADEFSERARSASRPKPRSRTTSGRRRRAAGGPGGTLPRHARPRARSPSRCPRTGRRARAGSAAAGPKDASLSAGDDAIYQTLLREDLGASTAHRLRRARRSPRFLHGIVGNWGWAIILLTLARRRMLRCRAAAEDADLALARARDEDAPRPAQARRGQGEVRERPSALRQGRRGSSRRRARCRAGRRVPPDLPADPDLLRAVPVALRVAFDRASTSRSWAGSSAAVAAGGRLIAVADATPSSARRVPAPPPILMVVALDRPAEGGAQAARP